MARSAAELRALVSGANQQVDEAAQALQLANDRLDAAWHQYAAISDKLGPAMAITQNAKTRVDEAQTLASQAKDLADAYSATL